MVLTKYLSLPLLKQIICYDATLRGDLFTEKLKNLLFFSGHKMVRNSTVSYMLVFTCRAMCNRNYSIFTSDGILKTGIMIKYN